MYSIQASDRVGILRRSNGCLHFFINGEDQGVAASDVPPGVYGVVDLYGAAVKVSIISNGEEDNNRVGGANEEAAVASCKFFQYYDDFEVPGTHRYIELKDLLVD